MWNRILQSITTFFSAGGGVVEQMCWDFCRERRKNLEKHKSKACSTKDISREDGLRRTLLCHSKYPVKQSLGHYLLMFLSLAQGTEYLRNVMTEGILSLCVSSLSTRQKEKQSGFQYFKNFFNLWFWHMTHSLHSDGRFLFSLDISSSTGFYKPCHKLKRNCACTECRTSSQKHLQASSVKLKVGIFLFVFASNIPSELQKLTRSDRTRLT